MSVGGIGSSSSISAIYQAWLKQQQQQAGSGEETQSEEAAAATSDSTAQQTDVKSLLSRLAASQPSLLDYLSGDGSSGSDTGGDSASSDASGDASDLKTVLAGIVNFDPNQAALDAFMTADSDSGLNSDADSSNPYAALMGSYNLGTSNISDLLDKLYSQTDASVSAASGSSGSGSGTEGGQTGDTQK
jgi:hypothetical protein